MEIGERLKEAREAKQLSLDRIQEITKIQKRYLVAIEEGNLNLLPGKFYARAFIKEYANAVGLNPDELLEEYKLEIPTPRDEEHQTIQYSRLQRSRKDAHTTKSSFSFFPTLIVVLLVIGIIFVAVTLYQKATSNTGEPVQQTDTDGIIRQDEPDQTEPPATIPDTDQDTDEIDEDEELEEPEPELEVTVLEQTNGETTYAVRHVSDRLQLRLESKGRTWLAVENGTGETLYSGELTEAASPQELDITTEDKIYIKMGFAPDLQVFVNDIELEIASEPHVQVLWIEIEK